MSWIAIITTMLWSLMAVTSHAWVMPHVRKAPMYPTESFLRPSPSAAYASRRTTRTTFLSASLGPDPDEEEECPDEEECEIDWSQMPGFDEDDEDEQATLSEDEGIIFYDDFGNDLAVSSLSTAIPSTTTTISTEGESSKRNVQQPKPSAASSSTSHPGSFGYGLRSLEMNWQMTESAEDCDVEQPQTCGSSECEACQGTGHVTCHFCRGTRLLAFQGLADWVPCTICRRSSTMSSTNPPGTVTCQKCQGSGWIAEWTQLAYHNDKDGDSTDNKDQDHKQLLP